MDKPPTFEDQAEELEKAARKAARGVLGADHAGVEDVVNGSLTRISDRWDILNEKGGSLVPYVTVVARNLAIDEQRKQKRLEPLMPKLEADDASGAVEDQLADFLRDGEYRSIGTDVANRQVLESALRTLNDETRHMVKLRFGYGFQNSEIAESMGLGEEAVGKRIQRAIPVVALLLWDAREDLLGKHRPEPRPAKRGR